MDADTTHLDGNVAGGELGALFAVEMTRALVRCAHCGTTEPVGAHLAYATALDIVLRCAHCEAALLSIVRGRNAIWLGMQGSAWLRIDEPPSST